MRLTGYIYGEDKPVKAVVTLVDNPTQDMQVIEIEPGYKYTIDVDPAALSGLTAIFSADGFKSTEVAVSDLAAGGGETNINLTKSMGLVTVGILSLAGVGLLASLKAKQSRKKTKVGKMSAGDVTPFLLIAGGLLAVNVIKKILDKLGLGGDPAAAPQSDPNSPWKPAYYKQYSNYSYAISLDQANGYAETIYNSFGVFQDDFNKIMSVFSNMRTKSNVSFLADIFSRKYDTDLLTFLTDGGGIMPWDGLSKDHLQTLIAYVNKLPSS